MTTVVFQPGPADGYDSYVDEANPNTNYETATSLGIESPTPNRRIAFINFFLASIPAGSVITSAKLSVYASVVNDDNRLYLHKIIDEWYVDTLTWNNRPIQGTAPIIKEASAGNWVEFNVKAIVQEWVNDPLWNLGVQISGALCPDVDTEIYSSDYLADPTKRPKLEVSYEPPAAGEQAARIYLSAAGQKIPSGVSTLIPLDTKAIGNDYIIYLPGNMIFPVEPGYYLCEGKISFSDIVGTCLVTVEIRKNGEFIAFGNVGPLASYQLPQVVTIVYCDGVNDYIQLYGYQNNGAARTLINSPFYTTMSVSKVGK